MKRKSKPWALKKKGLKYFFKDAEKVSSIETVWTWTEDPKKARRFESESEARKAAQDIPWAEVVKIEGDDA